MSESDNPSNKVNTVKLAVYILLFITAGFLAITTIYIEYYILSEMSQFDEPVYELPQYGISISGQAATLAHLFNILLLIISIFICFKAFKHIKRR